MEGLKLVPVAQLQEYGIIIALSCCSWATCFVLSRHVVFPRQTSDFSNRAISLVHALVAAALSYWAFDKKPFTGLGEANTRKEVIVMAVSLGYFVYDVIACSLMGEKFISNLIHHFVTMSGFVFGLLFGHSGTELCVCLFVMEISNPSLHLRTMLRELDQKDSALAFSNEAVFFATFTIFRMMVGPMLLYHTLRSQASHVFVKAGAFGIQAVNCFWYYKIFQGMVNKLSGKKSGRKMTAKKVD